MNAECIRRYYKTCNSEDTGPLRACYRDDVVLTHGSLEQADGTVNVELMDRFTA